MLIIFIYDSRLSIPLGTTTELNQIGFDFFTSMFVKHDKDRDRALCPEELMSLFATVRSSVMF